MNLVCELSLQAMYRGSIIRGFTNFKSVIGITVTDAQLKNPTRRNGGFKISKNWELEMNTEQHNMTKGRSPNQQSSTKQ